MIFKCSFFVLDGRLDILNHFRFNFSSKQQQQQQQHQPPTTNHQPPTTNNQQPTTNNQQPTTNNQQPTTNNQQPTTNNQQPTTNNQQPPQPTTTNNYHNHHQPPQTNRATTNLHFPPHFLPPNFSHQARLSLEHFQGQTGAIDVRRWGITSMACQKKWMDFIQLPKSRSFKMMFFFELLGVFLEIYRIYLGFS